MKRDRGARGSIRLRPGRASLRPTTMQWSWFVDVLFLPVSVNEESG